MPGPMRHRLLSRLVLLAIASYLVLPATAQGARKKPVRVASGQPVACASGDVDVTAATLERASDALLCLLNRERVRRGLAPLQADANLARTARAHSLDMVRRSYFEHESPDGRTPFDRILATRYVPKGASWTLGENIGWGTLSLATPAAIVKAWMASPAHRVNILDKRFRQIGIGIAVGVPQPRGQAGATYTTDFGRYS